MGDLYAGVYANDDDWSARILEAANAAGDHLWRFRCTGATAAM